jgi:hypothetical protein
MSENGRKRENMSRTMTTSGGFSITGEGKDVEIKRALARESRARKGSRTEKAIND